MTKDDFKYFIKNILPLTVLIGLVFGLLGNILEQNEEIKELEQRLEETQELLNISNDTLKQIEMYQEREFYMNQEADEDE